MLPDRTTQQRDTQNNTFTVIFWFQVLHHKERSRQPTSGKEETNWSLHILIQLQNRGDKLREVDHRERHKLPNECKKPKSHSNIQQPADRDSIWNGKDLTVTLFNRWSNQKLSVSQHPNRVNVISQQGRHYPKNWISHRKIKPRRPNSDKKVLVNRYQRG